MKVFSAASAEKIVVSIYTVLFALSFWWVVEVVRPGSGDFMIWGLVLGRNWFLSMGFYNFCFGLVFFMLCFGYWFKWRKSFGIRQWLMLLLLATLLYFTHLFCFLMAAFLIGVTGLFDCLSEAREGGGTGRPLQSFAKSMLPTVVIPELCFIVLLFLNPFGAIKPQYASHPETPRKIAEMLQHATTIHMASIFDLLLDCSGTLAWIFVLAVDAFVIVGLYWTLGRSRERISAVSYGLAVFTVTCLVLYFFGPSAFSEKGDLRERAGWFALWGAFAFLASREWQVRGKLIASGVATVACGLSVMTSALWRHQVSPLLMAYDDAAHVVQPGKTILSLCYCSPWNTNLEVFRRLTVFPLVHAGDIVALAGRDLSVEDYEGTLAGFPVEYLPQVNPSLHATELMEVEFNPGLADMTDYEAQTGRPIDYVLVWGEPAASDQSDSELPLWGQLQANYVLVYGAPGRTSLRIFQKKGEK